MQGSQAEPSSLVVWASGLGQQGQGKKGIEGNQEKRRLTKKLHRTNTFSA